MSFALITGASGGIGLAFARALASQKHDVLLVARSADKLQGICQELTHQFKVQADYLSLDLSRMDAALEVEQWLKQKNYGIDILINNAGFGSWGNINDLSREELNQMMQLNMLTLADLCKVLIPRLKANKKAYILNVASTASYQAVPTLATYAATKSFVLIFTRGLRWDLKGTPISVSCLSPGTTTTGFMDRANMNESLKKKAEKVTMTPEAVAKIGLKGMYNGKAEIIPGAINWISAKAAEILPKGLPESIAGSLYKTGK